MQDLRTKHYYVFFFFSPWLNDRIIKNQVSKIKNIIECHVRNHFTCMGENITHKMAKQPLKYYLVHIFKKSDEKQKLQIIN